MQKTFFIRLCLLGLILAIKAQAASSFNGSQFPLQMENNTPYPIWMDFQKGVGNVYLNPHMGHHTLLRAGEVGYTYGVNYAPRNVDTTFHIIFHGNQECVFTVGYFKPPEAPKVTFSGKGCEGAGYRVDHQVGYSPLVLYLGKKA